MITDAESVETPEKNLIDRIAESLPVDVRADYLRELRHCRSLPENDEMLRIIRVMQFLTLLIEQAPSRLASEREKLDRCLTECVSALQHTHERLDRLPREVASGISPEAIASQINESLRQQFLQSTIPQTAEALTVVATQLNKSVAAFQQAAHTINFAHQSAASDANIAVRNIEGAISQASKTATKAAEGLTKTIQEYRWSVLILVAIGLLAGTVFGIAFEYRLDSTAPVAHVDEGSVAVPNNAAPKKSRERHADNPSHVGR